MNPVTLFRACHFDQYLNENPGDYKQPSQYHGKPPAGELLSMAPEFERMKAKYDEQDRLEELAKNGKQAGNDVP
jgi:hypothetical protein